MAHIFTNGANLTGNHYDVSNTPTLAASGYQTITDASEIYSAVFTAPNIVNNSIGCAFYVEDTPYNSNTFADIFVRLQEYDGVSAWVTKASATISLYQVASGDIGENPNVDDMGWIYVNWDTPYQFTTISAGYYRIALQHDTPGASGQYRAANDSGGSNFAYLAVDDRTTAVGANDSLWVISDLTIDTSITLGNAVTTYTTRTLNNPINILNGGNIIGVSGSRTITMEGNFVVGTFGQFGNGTAVDSSDDLTFTFDMTGVTSNNIGILFSFYSKKNFSGASKTTNALYVSGDGATGTELVVPSDWAVNEKIYIQANDANGEQEKKYIKTKPTGTTATLSDTVGGVESAFSNNHDTDNIMINLTRNVKFNTNDSAKGFRVTDEATCYDFNEGDRTLSWIEFEYPADSYVYHTVVDYCAIHDGLDGDYLWNFRGIKKLTHTGTAFITNDNIVNWISDDMLVVFASSSIFQKLQDCFIFDSKEGIISIAGVENECNNCKIGDGKDGPLVRDNNPINSKFIDCEFNGADDQVFYLSDNVVGMKIIDCTSGNILDNGTFIRNFTNTSNPPKYKDIIIENTLVQDSNYWNSAGNENDTSAGSYIRMHKYQQTEDKHFTYLPVGSWQSTGPGLDDTTVRSSTSHKGLRFSPEDLLTGVVIEFKIPASANSTVYWFGYFKENAAFYGDGSASVTVELFLPGSTIADDTCNFSASAANVADGEMCAVIKEYTGSVSKIAKVRITVKSETAAAYVYLFDPYDGKNELTNLNTWEDARPIEFLFQDFQDPASVWNVLRSAANVANTMGEAVNDMYDKLPTNYIMGSSDQTDKDDEIDAIKAKTDNLPASPAAVGSEMNLANDAITSAKYDESTAFPVKSDDSGTTQIARTGNDGDTLEDLSDQIDTLPTSATIASDVWDEIRSGHNNIGSTGETINDINDKLPTNNFMGAGVKSDKDDEIDSIKSTVELLPSASDIDTQLSGVHGSGSWEGDTKENIASEVDSVLSGSHGAGSWEGSTPSNVADAVWDAAKADHTDVDSMGEVMNNIPDDPTSETNATTNKNEIITAIDNIPEQSIREVQEG